MHSWQQKSLGEFIELKRGYDLPSRDRVPGEFPLVTSSGPTEFISQSKVKGPGVVTGRCGTVGQVFYVQKDFWPLNTALYVRDFRGNDPRFAYYFLHGIEWEKFNDKSGVPGINRNDVHREPVLVPPLDQQEQIASVLSSLDDKIELNRRINETLEAMAQAIFRDWFIDFGPVRRKIAGATDPVAIMGGLMPDPARAAELAALFPDALAEDDLPVGWNECAIYDFAAVIYGAPFASKRFNTDGNGRPLVRIRDLPRHESGLFTDEVHSREYVIQPGDIVVGMDGEFRARVWQGVPSLMNQRVCCFAPKSQDWRAFVYFSIKPTLDRLEKSAVGTTVIHLGKGDIDRFTANNPGSDLIAAFGSIVEAMLDRLTANGLENRTLAETRDYLLPRLMSGEVRVGDAALEIAA